LTVAHLSLLTPLGFLTVFAENAMIVAVDFGRTPEGESTPMLVEAKRQIDAYFNGRLRAFDLPLAPAGGEFQQGVWRALCRIPYGATATYGDIARQVGGGARAVGGACGGNPIPIVIPCHRVLGAGGRLVGYSGGEGAETKRALLRLEGAMLL
jgi:methylated-DNA-[protein]-cysteine S-methyltransferase